MVRLLIVLSIIQTACVVYLLASRATRAEPTRVVMAAPADTAATAWVGVPPGFEDERLRTIIREELAQAGSVSGAPQNATAPAAPRAGADPRQREKVEQQLAHYRSVGRITASEMSALQGDIAELDPATRKAMLAELMRAMNAREIQGNL